MKNLVSALLIFSQVMLAEGGLWSFYYPMADGLYRLGFTYTYLL